MIFEVPGGVNGLFDGTEGRPESVGRHRIRRAEEWREIGLHEGLEKASP